MKHKSTAVVVAVMLLAAASSMQVLGSDAGVPTVTTIASAMTP